MTDEQFGRLMGLVERTHDDVKELKAAQSKQWEKIDTLRIDAAQHRLWIKALAAVLGIGAVGGGGAAGLLQILAGK